EQGPEDVSERLGLVVPLAQEGDEPGELGRGWLARKASDIELGDPFLGKLPGGDELGDESALLDLGVDGVAVEQVQRLGQGRLHLDLAGTGGLAGGAAEGLEEVRGRGAVGDLDGTRA